MPTVAPTWVFTGLTGRHRGIGEVIGVDGIDMSGTERLRELLRDALTSRGVGARVVDDE